ncbi:MAG TPA: MotA/TolQ/ExbB proton channel family protein [Myxococcales bacterium LLY-WYZ-16_1]|nr:MotA/TolQ/ExbB proton channel family protein [Myxococcales bacterium LLY-WYZ-16_1]
MSVAMEWFGRGGPVMPILLLVGLALYGLLAHRILQPSAREQDPTVIRALISAAPLLGLLGTVTGIVGSFEAMMVQGDARAMSAGIAEALTTTQYGLALAAPALLLERLLGRRRPTAVAPEHGAASVVTADRAQPGPAAVGAGSWVAPPGADVASGNPSGR